MAGLLSAAIAPLPGGYLVMLAMAPLPPTVANAVVRMAIGEVCAAVLGVCVCGLVWAVARPAWLPPLAWRYGRRAGLLLLVPYVLTAAWWAWPN